jgi:hypothetical protein
VASGEVPQNAPSDLSTADTAISVQAGERAPQLTGLRVGKSLWKNRTSEALPSEVEVGGTARAVAWQLDCSASRAGREEIELVYTSDSPRLRALWRWQARAGFGPLEHTIRIENLSSDTLWLPLQPSLRFDFLIDPSAPLERFWVEKGADTPSAAGTHLDRLRDGDTWQGTSSPYARPLAGEPREMIPYVLVQRADGERAGCISASNSAVARPSHLHAPVPRCALKPASIHFPGPTAPASHRVRRL